MSKRASLYVKRQREWLSPPSPNKTIDQITVELRVHFPPNTPNATILEMLATVINDAKGQLNDRPVR